MSDDCLPDCMMPDGGQCCAGYTKQRQRIREALENALTRELAIFTGSNIPRSPASRRWKADDVIRFVAVNGIRRWNL